jgi:hypothetical protein
MREWGRRGYRPRGVHVGERTGRRRRVSVEGRERGGRAPLRRGGRLGVAVEGNEGGRRTRRERNRFVALRRRWGGRFDQSRTVLRTESRFGRTRRSTNRTPLHRFTFLLSILHREAPKRSAGECRARSAAQTNGRDYTRNLALRVSPPAYPEFR